jgi:hypothetical protein
MERGFGTIHPADELHIAHGLQSGGTSRVFTNVVPDEAPEWVGPAAEDTIADRLGGRGTENQFHAIVQLRSTLNAPMRLQPTAGSAFDWRGRSTLRMYAEVHPWGSLDRIDDEERRESLRSAEELVYTSLWDLAPVPDDLPEELVLELATR